MYIVMIIYIVRRLGIPLPPALAFPGGSVVKNPAASAEDTGSVPGSRKAYVPYSN